MDENDDAQIDDDNWDRRPEPHPLNRTYLRGVAFLSCAYLMVLNWSFYFSEPMINIRCRLKPRPGDDCLGLADPSIMEYCSAFIQLFLYLVAPVLSVIGQGHHLVIYLFPSIWHRLPKNLFCNLHLPLWFPLYYELVFSIFDSINTLKFVDVSNPLDPGYNDAAIGNYIQSSVRALFNFMLFLQFPLYIYMAQGEERHARFWRQMRLERNE